MNSLHRNINFNVNQVFITFQITISAIPTTPALFSRRWTEYDDRTAMDVNKIL